jgi:hypothetical protein
MSVRDALIGHAAVFQGNLQQGKIMRIATVLRQFMFVGAALCVGASALIVATQSSPALPAGNSILGRPAVPGLQAPNPSVKGWFQLLTPPAGAWITPGTSVNITWTGGPPSWNVHLYLIDYDAWAVAATVPPPIPNNGAHAWTLPTSLPCNRRYLFYIDQVGTPSNNNYGPVFQLKCDIKVLKQKVGQKFTITIINGAFPISSLPTSIPEFRVTDGLPSGISVIGGSPTLSTGGVWTMTPVPAPAIIGPAQISLKFKLNTPVTIAPHATIAIYTLQTNTPINCIGEALYVSGTSWDDVNMADNASCI